LMGTFGATTIRVPRARLTTPEGKTAEWRNATIPAYQRRTKRADALITGAYLSGTNTRRVRRALAALFGGAVGRVWRKTKPVTDRPRAPHPVALRFDVDRAPERRQCERCKAAFSIPLLASMPNEHGGRPVLAHRLDRDTSGVLLVAKTRSIPADLGEIFRQGSTAARRAVGVRDHAQRVIAARLPYGGRAIFRVANDRMTDRLGMGAQLVGAPGHRLASSSNASCIFWHGG
jgi:hypothetical protein